MGSQRVKLSTQHSGPDDKESACNAGDRGLIPGSGRYPGPRREWLPTPVFLPEEFHGQRILLDPSPCGHKKLGMTEQLTLTFFHLNI